MIDETPKDPRRYCFRLECSRCLERCPATLPRVRVLAEERYPLHATRTTLPDAPALHDVFRPLALGKIETFTPLAGGFRGKETGERKGISPGEKYKVRCTVVYSSDAIKAPSLARSRNKRAWTVTDIAKVTVNLSVQLYGLSARLSLPSFQEGPRFLRLFVFNGDIWDSCMQADLMTSNES